MTAWPPGAARREAAGKGDEGLRTGRWAARLRRWAAVVLAAVPVAVAGCGSAAPAGQGPAPAAGGGTQTATNPVTVRMVEQFGLSYLPVQVMVKNKLIEKYLPGARVEAVRLAAGAPVTEALISGQADVGFLGVGPALIAIDKGLDVRIAAALNAMDIDMNTWKPNIRTLRDITPQDRIALPGPGSIQDVVLQMAAQQQLGDPRRFSSQLVAMAHPDGLKALLAHSEVTLHFSSPPFQQEERKSPGVHLVLSSYDVLGGPHTFNVVLVPGRVQKDARVYDALIKALGDAHAFIREHPDQAADIEASTGDKTPHDELVQLIKDPQNIWDSTPRGLMKFAEFMYATGALKHKPQSWKQYVWPNLDGVEGS